jgi:uncharacterized membrane protein YphA (DoxX/SURF4 family)
VSDIAFGYLLLAIGIGFALAIVYALTSRIGRVPRTRPKVPRGVHLPPPSILPAVMAVGATLLGASLAFRADNQPLANPFLAVPALVVMLVAIVSWIRAAGREWRETETGSAHDDAPGH